MAPNFPCVHIVYVPGVSSSSNIQTHPGGYPVSKGMDRTSLGTQICRKELVMTNLSAAKIRRTGYHEMDAATITILLSWEAFPGSSAGENSSISLLLCASAFPAGL